MRLLLVLAWWLPSIAAADVAPEVRPFTPSIPEAVVVAPEPMPDAMRADFRHAFRGKVSKIRPDVERGTLVVVGAHRFRITTPGNVALPFRVRDEIRVEIWSTTASDGPGLGSLHARITDAHDAPLVLLNAAPAGWTFEIGHDAHARRQHPAIAPYSVQLRAPGLNVTAFGWVRARIEGADYIVELDGSVVDRAAAAKHPDQPLPTWTQRLNTTIVRVPAARRR